MSTSAAAPRVPQPGDSDWKDNNPKDAFGTAKVSPFTYMSMPVIFEQSIGMAAGGYKYGAHNYLAIPPSAMVYVDACLRHLMGFVGGEMMDPNAGPGVLVRHVTAAQNSLHVLNAAIINNQWIDDRPPEMPAGFVESFAEQMKILQTNNPDPVARYLSGGRRGPGRILKS